MTFRQRFRKAAFVVAFVATFFVGGLSAAALIFHVIAAVLMEPELKIVVLSSIRICWDLSVICFGVPALSSWLLGVAIGDG